VVSPPLYRAIGRESDLRDDGTHINVNETIDASVFKRWRADPTYRSANLVEWAQRKKVDPAQLQTSVRADDAVALRTEIDHALAKANGNYQEFLRRADSMIEAEVRSIAAEERTRAVLEGLASLGYEVSE